MKILRSRQEIAEAMNFGKYPVVEMDVKNELKIGREIVGYKGGNVRTSEHITLSTRYFFDEKRITFNSYGTILKSSFGYDDIIEDLENAHAPVLEPNTEFVLVLHNSKNRKAIVMILETSSYKNINCSTTMSTEMVDLNYYITLLGD